MFTYFVPNLSAKVQELRRLAKKDSEFCWEEQQTKLDKLKAYVKEDAVFQSWKKSHYWM